jgi:hypothetical protein
MFLFYIFITNAVGFNTIQTIHKFRNQSINKKSHICMGLQKREFVYKPVNIFKLTASVPFITPLFNPKNIKVYNKNISSASKSADYWSRNS